MGCVVAVVSPQGGAAKSVAVMVIAETLAAQKRKSVLVIDCDPEARSSMLLASTPRWTQVEARQHTVLHLLEQALAYQRMPDIDSFVIAGCSKVAGAEAVALVAGHPGLALFDWRTGKDEESIRQFRRVLKHFVALIRDHFDVILVDCPAALGALTEAWLAIADAFFTPIRPDAMAAGNIAVLRAVERDAAANRLAFPEDLGVLIALKDETLTSHIIGHRRLDDDLANRCFPLAIPPPRRAGAAGRMPGGAHALQAQIPRSAGGHRHPDRRHAVGPPALMGAPWPRRLLRKPVSPMGAHALSWPLP